MDYIRAEGDFQKRDIQLKGPIGQRSDRKNRVRKRRVVWKIYGRKYSRKGRKDRNTYKNRIKGVGKLGWFMSDINQ